MKRFFSFLVIAFPLAAFAQGGMGIGVKAGVNFANITKASMIDNSNRTGFHAGIFLAPPARGIMGSRTELIFSRQGYNYATNTNTGNVNLDYIMLPQFMTINITKFFQVQLGGQMAFLLNAKVDSSNSNTNIPGGKIMDLYNRFDYGYGGGVELRPAAGLVIGGRVNISLGKMYKTPEPGQQPSFFPSINAKNNVVQLYAGWIFGKKKKKGQ